MSKIKMKNDNFIDFVTKTGQNIGEVQNTKLAKYLGNSEGAIRNLRDKEPLKFDCLYLGALCKTNNITKEDLIKIKKDKNVKLY